jgi:predicted P-loop ATPase
VWIHEWADLGAIKGKDGDRLKAFLSSTHDRFRPAYARTSVRKARRAVFCATTNKDRFLVENDGDRRVWIIPVSRVVPVDLIRAHRDLFWAEAVARYDAHVEFLSKGGAANDSPFKWWLSREEESKREELNAEHRSENPWIERIREISAALPAEFTLYELSTRHLNIDTSDVERYQHKIGAALRALKFEQKPVAVEGEAAGSAKRRVWFGGSRAKGDEPGTQTAPMPELH